MSTGNGRERRRAACEYTTYAPTWDSAAPEARTSPLARRIRIAEVQRCLQSKPLTGCATSDISTNGPRRSQSRWNTAYHTYLLKPHTIQSRIGVAQLGDAKQAHEEEPLPRATSSLTLRSLTGHDQSVRDGQTRADRVHPWSDCDPL